MADIAASILQPVVDHAVKGVSAVVKRQFNYLCCFTANVNGLEVEAKTLDDATRGVQGEVERERENAQDIVPAVVTWLTDSNDFKGEVNGILNEVPNVKSGCFKLSARYSLSKKAMKTTEAMKVHRQKWMEIVSNGISHPKPPAAAVQIPSAGTPYEFESRKQIEDKIMTCLKGDDRDMIGIYGMGGLGKTTMANKIRNRALDEHVFDEVVMAVVSQQVDESKIQQQIAEQLGVYLVEQTLMARANRLRERLNDSKRTLLVLDDVWERLKLVELGIPCCSEGCRILFTSRNHDALSGMDVGKVFGMEILSEEEAWLLFRGKAGKCVDDMRLNSIAEEVVEECRGLPIALVTVGAAMKDEMDERIWKDAVKQLRKANPKNIPEFIKEVYNPMEVSYTKLASEEAKSVCLLCCLFPEDNDISVNWLTYFCMGLHILEDVMSLEDARDRTWALIKLLKSRSLLLDSKYTNCVRMHDVVRDVCTFIAKQKGYIGGNECNWSSSFEIPMGMDFPNLRLLVNIYNPYGEEEIKVNINTFFEGIRDLSVLSMRYYPWTSLPPTPMQSLKNLGTLILESCEELETISVVGDLVNLEILICSYCDLIKELPVEMGRLNRLKLLDITGCRNLQSIGYGIISSLVGLEELKMWGSFKKWEAEDKEDRKNVGLRELESLINLRCLEIEIEDAALAAQNMHLSSNLKRFKIRVGCERSFIIQKRNRMTNMMELGWEERTSLGYWIQMQLLRDTQLRLYLTGDGVNNLELEKISYNIFTNLSAIHIKNCPHLHNLGQLSIAGNDCLPHLEFLRIERCEVMEQVFLWNQEEEEENKNDDITKILFPKLKEVWLDSLPNLTTFCQGIDKCPKMTSMISSCCVNRIGSNEDHSSHLFCQQQKVSFLSLNTLTMPTMGTKNPFCCHKIPMSFFNGLKEVTISWYEGRMSLFTSSIARSLVSLKYLRIDKCSEMEQVIKEEEKTVSGGQRRTLVFPNLHSIDLCNLPKLVTFYDSKCDVEFPSLTSMEVEGCPNMTNFTLGRLIAPNWEAWQTDLKHSLDVSTRIMKKFTFIRSENPLCHYKMSESFFTRLDKLRIVYYRSSMSLISSTIARNLANLRDLEITNSDEIIQVIKDDDEEKVVSGGEKTPLFPKLEKLELSSLPKLVTFCEWNCDIELPSLKNVRISRCPNMRNVTLGLLTTPLLASIIIGHIKHVGATKDLNGMLQQHFIRAKEAKEEVEQKNENEEEQSNFINIKERKSEQEEEEENENEKEEEKQSNNIKSEEVEMNIKGEIEEEQN